MAKRNRRERVKMRKVLVTAYQCSGCGRVTRPHQAEYPPNQCPECKSAVMVMDNSEPVAPEPYGEARA